MKISISLPDELVARMERERGLASRSAWIRSRLELAGPMMVERARTKPAPPSPERSPAPAVEPAASPDPSPPKKSYSELPMRERLAALEAEKK